MLPGSFVCVCCFSVAFSKFWVLPGYFILFVVSMFTFRCFGDFPNTFHMFMNVLMLDWILQRGTRRRVSEKRKEKGKKKGRDDLIMITKKEKELSNN